MGAFLTMLVQVLMPVAVQAAKDKIASGNIVPPSPTVIAVQDAVVGGLQSKTMWIAVVTIVCGFLEQNQQLLSQYIGADKMGIVLSVVGGIMMLMRAITGTTLSEKANGVPAGATIVSTAAAEKVTAFVPSASQQPPASS